MINLIGTKTKTLPNDILGIKMLYPTKTGSTNSWFISDGFEDDPRVRLDENVSGNNSSGYSLDDNSKVRFSVAADTQDTDIGCENNFALSSQRGYVNKSNDWKNIEMTGFFIATFMRPTDNYIVMKGPTGEHHSDTTCCSGSSYNSYMLQTNPVATEFAKEMWHVNYDRRGTANIPGENYTILGHGWFGMKYVHYVTDNDTVKLEIWYNPNGDGQTWKLANSTEDTGGWGDEGDVCGGDEDHIHNYGNARMMWRWDFRDGSDIKFKNLSIREIDPFSDFDNPTDPTNPPTNPPSLSTFTSNLKLQRHINYSTASCGPGGTNAFYDNIALTPTGALGITKFYYDTIGIGEYAVNSSSEMVGHILHSLEIPLRKTGSPAATPTVKAKIFDSGHNLIYTSPTTFDPTTFSTSFVTKTFDFSANTRVFVSGDTVEIEVDETTSSTDYVQVAYTTTLKTNSSLYYWEDGARFNDTTRELICKMIE